MIFMKVGTCIYFIILSICLLNNKKLNICFTISSYFFPSCLALKVNLAPKHIIIQSNLVEQVYFVISNKLI